MIKSRSAPNRARSGPLSLVARIPPMVARSGQSGSQARRWPCSARACCNRATLQPASTVAVRSAQACSSTRWSRVVDRTRSARRGGWPQSSFVPPPRGTTARPARLAEASTRASASSVPGSMTLLAGTPSTASAGRAGRTCSGPTTAASSSQAASACCVLEELGDTRGLEGMRLVGARPFGAQPRTREDFRRVRQPLGIEGAPHALHGVEVGLGEHHGHEGFLLFADAVLAGDRAAGLDAQLEDAERQPFGPALLALDPTVVE